MKTSTKRVLTICLTLVLLVAIFMGMNVITRDKSGIAKTKDFYAHSEDYDVLIMGSSHSVMGILPLELWHHNGITSYNLANYGQSMGVDYWTLRNALQYADPEVVVIDVYTLFFDEKYSYVHLPYVHQQTDTMPMSGVKYEMFMDMFQDENKMEFEFPFSLYHSRWDELTMADFGVTAPTGQLGADANQYIGASMGSVDEEMTNNLYTWMHEYELLPISEKVTEYNCSFDYLRMMIEMCQSEGIEVLLVASPVYATETNQRYINCAYDIAQEYGITFINGLRDNNVFYESDFFDTAHLNSSGACKWTAYLGDILAGDYGVADRRGEEALTYFDDYYEAWILDMFTRLKENTSVYGSLVLASNENNEVTITLRDESFIVDNERLAFLIDNCHAQISYDSSMTADITISVYSTIANEIYTCSYTIEE